MVREFQRRGVRFVASEQEVPEGAVCVFSAPGVSPQVRQNADARGLDVIDATCPLVAEVHQEARRFARDGRTLLLVGHADHEEVEGTYGHAPDQTITIETVADAEALDLPPRHHGNGTAMNCRASTGSCRTKIAEQLPGLAGLPRPGRPKRYHTTSLISAGNGSLKA